MPSRFVSCGLSIEAFAKQFAVAQRLINENNELAVFIGFEWPINSEEEEEAYAALIQEENEEEWRIEMERLSEKEHNAQVERERLNEEAYERDEDERLAEEVYARAEEEEAYAPIRLGQQLDWYYRCFE